VEAVHAELPRTLKPGTRKATHGMMPASRNE
jgi:hypothetical protein